MWKRFRQPQSDCSVAGDRKARDTLAALFDLLESHAAFRQGMEKSVASRSGAAKWRPVRDKRRPGTLPDSGSENYDPKIAARMMKKEVAKRWNLGTRKTPMSSGCATTDHGGKLPPRPWLTSSAAPLWTGLFLVAQAIFHVSTRLSGASPQGI